MNYLIISGLLLILILISLKTKKYNQIELKFTNKQVKKYESLLNILGKETYTETEIIKFLKVLLGNLL